jgi:SAM-dependent methyltransferase
VALPFYGASDPELFSIERRAMDRPGRVLAELNQLLPEVGVVVDVGAGDGFTAEVLNSAGRRVLAVEPAAGMRRPGRVLGWIAGVAQALPLQDASADAAYSTWAYFFTGAGWDPSPGLAELHRVVRRGGSLLIVDNVGDDEFTALSGDASSVTASVEQWRAFGFDCRVVETVFEFETREDADRLLGLYFGDADYSHVPLSLSYNVGIFTSVSRGSM